VKLNRLMTPRLIWLLLMVMGGTFLVPSATAAFKYLHEGMNAPTVKGKDVTSGESISSDKYFDDQNMVIVVFWATWSKRSLDELEALKEIVDEVGEQPVRIIAVNVEGQDMTAQRRQEVVDFSQALALPFPSIMDEKLDIFYEFGVIAVPSTAIFDTTGILRYGPAGYSLTTRDLIVDSILVLLGIREPSLVTPLKRGYQPKPKANRYYNLALGLSRRRMYERAQTNLEQARSIDSNFAMVYNLMGEIQLKLGDPASAIDYYSKAVAIDSTVVSGWAGLGRAYLRDGQIEAAMENLAAALKLDESYTPAFLDLGLSLAQKGEISQALDSLNKAVELNFMNPIVHYYLGQVHMQAADTAAAVTALTTALELFYPSQ